MATQSLPSDHTSSDTASGDADAFSSLRILVVEDSPEMADLIRHLLEWEGYGVIELHSGAEALDLIAAVERGDEEPFDVALLDIMMPQVSGYAVCQEIRQTESLGYIPIIMVTALGSMDDMVHGLDLGADDYLVKPFNSQELLARVRAALRVRDMDRAMRRRNWQLAILNSLNDAIGESLDSLEVLRAGMSHVLHHVDLDYVVAFLRHRRSGELATVLHYDGQRWSEDQLGSAASSATSIDGGAWQECDAYRLALSVVASGRRQWQTGVRGASKPQGVELVGDWQACVPLQTESPAVAGLDQAVDSGAMSAANVIYAPLRSVLGILLAGASADKPMIDLDLLTAIGNQIGQALVKCQFYQQARQRSEELVALFDSISDVIYVVDDAYRISAPNVALIRWLTGRKQQSSSNDSVVLGSVVGQVCYELLYDRNSPCRECQMTRALEVGRNLGWTDVRRRPDGEREEWEISAHPIQGREGQAAQVIILARDVTERRMLEVSLSQSEKLAALGQLSAGLAHEINNPLTAIIANAQLLLKSTRTDDPSFESLALIKQASDRAARVVRNLLDFARQEQYEFEPTDLNSSLRAALELVNHQFRIAQVSVTEELAPDLPPAMVSRDHLEGVWLNLLLNARDAVTQQKRTNAEPHIWVGTRLRDDSFLEVSVRDNGIGIPSEKLKQIFEPFFTTKDPGKGTGLGLSTAFRVVKQHGGDLQVDSELGVGSTFTVLLPAIGR